MKAIQVHNPGKNSSLTIEDAPDPQPEKNEILIRIKASAVNRADLHQRSGNYPPPEGASEILGLEMAGVVEKTGENTEHWKEGDRVFGLLPGGGYAQYCVLPEKMAMRIPENLSYEEAAAIPETFLTGYQSLKWIGDMKRADTVLVHAGASGVGTAAIQLAHHLFDARIATTASKKEKLQIARDLGADLAINYNTQDFAKEIVREFGEQSVDLIIDFIGAPYWEQNIKVLNMDGRIVYLSFLGGHELDTMSLAPLLKKRLKVMGSTLRNRSEAYKIKLTREFAQTLGYFEEGILKPVVDQTFDWEETEEAHRYMAQNKNMGKIVLTGM